ncbi:MAG: hypothetical protein LBC85_00245, partial [Fibromonadaceae bacterium]|nr:hypothetical protein [Fibromonadaceae bacterium]
GNHWDNGECKTDAQLAEEACVADGKVWENNACRNKTAAELCTEAGNHWDNGECKTDAQLAEEACLADGKVWENNACRNKTDTELCVEAGNTWDNGECKTDAQLAEEACLADGKVWQDNACRDDNTPIIPNPENPKIGAIGVQTYYNLHGQPLGTQKPTIPGVYIEKRGKYMRKIAVR